MPPAWPEPEYLDRLGRMVYAVASIEGLLIFDLTRLSDPVPPGADPADLAGRTTHQVGQQLVGIARKVADPAWRAYLTRGGDALLDIAPRRNRVLHARPATIDGKQMLHRSRLNPTDVVDITIDHLDGVLEVIEVHNREVHDLRPAFR